MDEIIEKIKDIYIKYEENSNSYVLQRIHNHITNLPSILESEFKNHEKRKERTNLLTQEQNVFVQIFLSKNRYFYLANNSCFYEYNGQNYSVVKEDDILHKLLSNISEDKTLMQWKYKTKSTIIKQIKERNLFTSIPETATIQNVLGLFYPSVFKTKTQAKYFLTIIGDNILKKNSDLLIFVNPTMKKILIEIDNIAHITICNSNTTHNFITKYHENHNLQFYRLVNANANACDAKDYLKNYGLDILCVATHYSTRYESSEHFINNKAYEDLKKYTLFLKNNNQMDLVNKFCNQCIVKTETVKTKIEIVKPENNNKNNTNGEKTNEEEEEKEAEKEQEEEKEEQPVNGIQWKNIHYIWKQFVSGLNLPNIIYSNTLKQLLKNKLVYNEETDCFLDITSKHLPIIKEFIHFWENNVYYDMDNELEMDEVCNLFHDCKNIWLSEPDILNILRHFFKNTEIVENKYILNYSCSLFNKAQDISNSLKAIKTTLNPDNGMISFDELYTFYCSQNNKYIANKCYFEKYLYNQFGEFIIFDKFLSTNCFWLF